jgi:S1-C subfamily serine protease
MTRWCLAVVTWLMLSPVAFAGEIDAEIERAIEEARRQIDEAAQVLAELHTKQYAMGSGQKKAMLGILLSDGSHDGGVEVEGLTPGGGAEQAGLQSGDLIVKLDDLSLSAVDAPMREMSKYMKGITPGDVVNVDYERNGERQSVALTTQARSKYIMKILADKMEDIDIDIDIDIEKLIGMQDGHHKTIAFQGHSPNQLLAVSGDLAQYFDVKKGVVVIKPAADSELKGGDVLLKIAGDEIETVADAREALAELEAPGEVTVKRRGKRRQINVDAAEFELASDYTKVIHIKRPHQDEEKIVIEVTD